MHCHTEKMKTAAGSPEAVFIDRDGTMCESAAIEYPQQFIPLQGLKSMLEKIRSTGAKLFVFSNQSCIARGKDGGYDFEREFRELGFDDWFLCPHDRPDGCSCRKPQTGLLEQARKKYGLSMENCWVIGDRWSDMLPGGQMGCHLILVLTGRGREALGEDRSKWSGYSPDFVAADLGQAARWLREQFPGREREEWGGLPRDPMILFSYVNTQMRDRGLDLDGFCREWGVPTERLCRKLEEAGFSYDPQGKRFW